MTASGLDILLVEDSEPLAANIIDYLETRGHRIDWAAEGETGLARALEGAFDVVILDIALPRLSGLDVCRAIRERATRHVPVLMLTARDTLQDKLQGFERGADDYLTKPFALPELAARIGALSMRPQIGRDTRLTVGPLTLDRALRQATRNGAELTLTPITWLILETLVLAHPAPVTRSDLTRRIWGDEPPMSDALRSHMRLLRLALDRSAGWPMLHTIQGVGFRLKETP